MEREKRKVEIPNDWSGISIQMYQKFQEVRKRKLEKEEFNLEVLGVICGLDKGMIEKLEVKSLNKILKTLKFLSTDIPESQELVKKVEWNGVKYGFIPNLSEITTGEYIDIEQYCKEGEKNLHKIMSILYRPIVKETKTRYSIEHYKPSEDLEEEFLDFPILPSMSALSFFFHLGRTLPNALGRYLKKEIKKMREAL
jgi:hypothetical protein|tara:strand:+ start:310 stop:900 length:591 start_codon:yes stop_codon:yes gene_type:complete